MKSAEMIGWALGGLEREIALTKERLSALTAQAGALRAKLPAAASRAANATMGAGAATGEAVQKQAGRAAKRARRKMSPEARKRIAEMMKKRWAERKKKGHTRL